VMLAMAQVASVTQSEMQRKSAALGVRIEAEYTVGEYDILILSATQSDGLVTWLNDGGYKMPAGASPVLGSYIKQSMKFFVARVNLKEQDKLGFRICAQSKSATRRTSSCCRSASARSMPMARRT